MVDGHRSESWQHTSALLCLLANVHRDVKKHPRAYSPAEFNPAFKKDNEPPIKSHVRVLKGIFVRNT